MDFTLTKEQQDIMKAAREFAQGEFPDRAQEFDREETFDFDIWRRACSLGFVGMSVKEEYGGGGMGLIEECIVMEEFWAADAGIASAVLSPAFGADLIEIYGTKEQKRRYISPLMEGKAIMACGITEPDAGSDVSQVSTDAVRDGNDYVINGSKIFITNGDVADYVLLFCRTDPDNPNRHARHSWILVETDRNGFEARKLKGKLGIRANTIAELSFADVRVPRSNLLGKEGDGFKALMVFFDRSRIVISAQGSGLARAALEESIKHTKKRHQFDAPLSSFQAIQFKIAEMATRIKASRNLIFEAAWKADHGVLDSTLISMAKWYSAETAVRCADEALQMHGGYGYIDEYKVQRIYRDAKILEIYEGSKEIEKNIIGRRLLA